MTSLRGLSRAHAQLLRCARRQCPTTSNWACSSMAQGRVYLRSLQNGRYVVRCNQLSPVFSDRRVGKTVEHPYLVHRLEQRIPLTMTRQELEQRSVCLPQEFLSGGVLAGVDETTTAAISYSSTLKQIEIMPWNQWKGSSFLGNSTRLHLGVTLSRAYRPNARNAFPLLLQ